MNEEKERETKKMEIYKKYNTTRMERMKKELSYYRSKFHDNPVSQEPKNA